MILRILRLVRGVVVFEVRGGYLERFINLCAKNGISVWDGRRVGGSYIAKTTLSEAKQLPEIARKAGLTLTIKKKTGLPHLFYQYRRRLGIFAGLCILLSTMVVMGSFVWQVNIVGNEAIPQEEIVEVLGELGVRRGTLRREVDTRDVERQMMLRLENIAWVAVNLRGSTATVEVRERSMPPAIVDIATPTNIVASRTGFIVRMEVYEGQPTVRTGDGVAQGDILVSGIMEDKKGKNRTVHARAKIIAQVEDSLAVTVPYVQTAYVYRGLEIRRSTEILGFTVPLFLEPAPEGPFKLETAREPIPLLSRLLPVFILRQNYILLEEVEESISPEAAKAQAEWELARLEAKSFDQSRVLHRQVTGQELEDKFILFADYEREEDIAEEREILIKDPL